MMHRLTPNNCLDVYTLISILLSPADSSFNTRILPKTWCFQDWLEYVYRSSHPVLSWLPTKLSAWIGKNLQEALGFADKAMQELAQAWGGLHLSWIIFCRLVNTSIYMCIVERLVCTGMHWSVMMFGLYSAGTCCGWYLDNLWLCCVGVWAFPGCNASHMLPLQASKQALSWCEPTGIHVHNVQVHASAYWNILLCTSMYQNILEFTSVYIFIQVRKGWGVCRTP
jgi:hypothetical protein